MNFKTFKTVLNEMNEAYFNEMGEYPAPGSEPDLWNRAAARELFAVYTRLFWSLKNLDPKTAQGEYLDTIASFLSLERKSATASAGEVTFYLDNAEAEDLTIPQGTVCCSSLNPEYQFKTTQDAVITAGGSSVNAPCVSDFTGLNANIPPLKINIAVNPPSNLLKVKNNASFSGAVNAESDEGLRGRIFDLLKGGRNVFCRDFVVNRLREIESVLDAALSVSDGGTLKCALLTQNGEIDEKTKKYAENALYFAEVCGVKCEITAPEITPLTVKAEITVEKGADHESAGKKTRELINSFYDSLHIGRAPEREGFVKRLLAEPDIVSVRLRFNGAVNPKCGTLEVLRLEKTELEIIE